MPEKVSLSVRMPGQLHRDLQHKLIDESQPGKKETINGMIVRLLKQYVYGPPK